MSVINKSLIHNILQREKEKLEFFENETERKFKNSPVHYREKMDKSEGGNKALREIESELSRFPDKFEAQGLLDWIIEQLSNHEDSRNDRTQPSRWMKINGYCEEMECIRGSLFQYVRD